MAINPNIYWQHLASMPQKPKSQGLASLVGAYDQAQARKQQAEQLKLQQAANTRQQELLEMKKQQQQAALAEQQRKTAQQNVINTALNGNFVQKDRTPQGISDLMFMQGEQGRTVADQYDKRNKINAYAPEVDPYELWTPAMKAQFAATQDPRAKLALRRANDAALAEKKAGSTKITNTVGGVSTEYGKLEDGMMRTWPNGSDNPPVDVPIDGSKTAYNRNQDKIQQETNNEIVGTAAQTVYEDSTRALDLIDKYGFAATGSFGIGTSWIPEAPAGQLKVQLESIKGNVAVDQLLKIKKSGAGLGQVPQQQLEMLARLLGELSVNTHPAILKYNVERVNQIYTDIVEKTGGNPVEAYADRLRNLGGGRKQEGRKIQFIGFE